jgi:hypothetical protein
MSRRGGPSLFPQPPAYAVDTSSWLNVDSLPEPEDAWVTIQELIKKGRLFTCAQVLTELRSDPIYLLRIKPFEKALLSGGGGINDPEYLQMVGRITHDFPAMSKARSSKTPADSYIVGLAQMEEYILVADEGTRRINRKIPGACQQLGIRCITISQLIKEVSNEGKAME